MRRKWYEPGEQEKKRNGSAQKEIRDGHTGLGGGGGEKLIFFSIFIQNFQFSCCIVEACLSSSLIVYFEFDNSWCLHGAHLRYKESS